MPAISFSGLASGLDSAAIINSLVDVQRIPVLRLQQDNSFNASKIGIIDSLSSALSDLRTKATDLDTAGEFLSYSGSVSTESAAKVTTSGDAVAGSYSLDVTSLANAQRTYSDTVADKTAALSASDETLSITIGGTTTDIDVTAGSSLEDVVGLVNAAGIDAQASIMFDGTDYRLQVAGTETGAANAITFADTGLALGLETPANTVQAATDAQLTIDGFAVTSATNIIDDALAGTTLELKETTTSPVTLTIGADTDAVQEKVQAFVDAYNSVFSIINDQVGEGKGENTLNGDSTLRTIEIGLANVISSSIPGLQTSAGDTLQLGDLGISTQTDGTLTLDSSKLDETLAGGFSAAASYFAGDAASATDGIGGILDDLIDSYTNSADGLLTARKDGIEAITADNDSRIEELERYLDSYRSNLEQQYTALESAMSALQSQQSYLAQFVNSL